MWPNPLETVDLVTFTEEILKGKIIFHAMEQFEYFINPSSDDFTVTHIGVFWHTF